MQILWQNLKNYDSLQTYWNNEIHLLIKYYKNLILISLLWLL